MKKKKGDLLQLALEGEFDVIIHGCNCFCTMGAGIANSIKNLFPEAFKADLNTIKGDKSKLGTFSYAKHIGQNGDLTIINGYTQFDWKGTGVKADYNAIRQLFKSVKMEFGGNRIGYPAIGAGLAGGDWNIISEIIDEELDGEDHTFIEFAK